jgi:hypothetical protein
MPPLGRAVHVHRYAVLAIQYCVLSKGLSDRTGEAVALGIVGKRAGHELDAAALCSERKPDSVRDG